MRSGTKWLSNILCNHPKIAGIQSTRARGILETNMFHRMQAKFDLRSADEYIGFIEMWKSTEFFRLTNLDASYLYELNPRPLSFVSLFEHVMESYAGSQRAEFWLQKCDPERALEVIPVINRPRVITIRRDIISVVQSLRNISRNRHHDFSLVKAIPGIARAERLLSKVEKSFNALPIEYEQLKANPETTVRSICDHLGINYCPSMLQMRYDANTSFSKERPAPLGQSYRAILRATHALSKLVPLWFLDRMLRIDKPQPPSVSLVAGSFGDLKDRLKDRRDYR